MRAHSSRMEFLTNAAGMWGMQDSLIWPREKERDRVERTDKSGKTTTKKKKKWYRKEWHSRKKQPRGSTVPGCWEHKDTVTVCGGRRREVLHTMEQITNSVSVWGCGRLSQQSRLSVVLCVWPEDSYCTSSSLTNAGLSYACVEASVGVEPYVGVIASSCWQYFPFIPPRHCASKVESHNGVVVVQKSFSDWASGSKVTRTDVYVAMLHAILPVLLPIITQCEWPVQIPLFGLDSNNCCLIAMKSFIDVNTFIHLNINSMARSWSPHLPPWVKAFI